MYLAFIRSQRERNFKLNVSALLKYVFAMDRKNYKRWMSISVHGLQTLSTLHPDIYREYNDNGSFMVQKSERVFSAIPKDQAHEQNNKIFKPLNGGLSSDIALKWIVAGPEINRLTNEFEGIQGKSKMNNLILILLHKTSS